MRNSIDLDSKRGLRVFADVIVEMFNVSLNAITGQSVNAEAANVYTCDANTLTEGFMDQALIAATEEKTGFESGMLFQIRDITMLADLMLMGEGEPRHDLDEEVTDAIRELGSQLLASLNVPIEERLGKKLQFRTDDVSKLATNALFQADKYLGIDITATAADQAFMFKFFVDDELSFLLESGDSVVPDDAFQENGGGGGSSGGGGGGGGGVSAAQLAQGTNLDMLLDIEMPVSVRMGSSRLFLKDILGLGPGNIVELDQNADEAVELSVNDKIIARGEVVIVDGYFGFRIKEIVSKAERIKKLKD